MTASHVVGAALVLPSLVSGVARSELEVIYDSGTTQPLAPFLEIFGGTPTPRAAVRSGDDLGAADTSRLLPIRSPGLTPGLVARRQVKLSDPGRIPRPFFLIGSDLRSREWLATHRDRLEQLGAVGMLVQADSVEDLEEMARIAEGLPVLPASATDIARALGLEHFPVLVSRRGIEQ
jgi:integrating conjugative element protein (TIGR03765 family)